IAEAARRPNLYAALIARHSGESLPTLLTNLIVREHGVLPSVAETAAKNFRETMEFAGLLRKGILSEHLAEDAPEEAPEEAAARVEDARPVADPSRTRVASGPSVASFPSGITIPLDATGRIATIGIPLPITKRDLKRIAAW